MWKESSSVKLCTYFILHIEGQTSKFIPKFIYFFCVDGGFKGTSSIYQSHTSSLNTDNLISLISDLLSSMIMMQLF